MKIVCDSPKQVANLEKHGLDMAAVTEAFFATAVVAAAKKHRFLAFGMIGEMTVAVVFKPLGTEAISVISARPANKKERQFHDGQKQQSA